MAPAAPIIASRLTELIAKPLPEIAKAIATGNISSVLLTQYYLERIDRLNPSLQAYITVTAETALAQASTADRALAEGRLLGPLHGVPIALKDLCETDFAPTSNGMAIFRDRTTGRNAKVVSNLLAAGAVILGKLAMAEGACSTHHPQMPVPVNPWGASFRVGSSSSGSGVAVAAGLAAAAVGSDTGGSIRFPAAYCGVTGLKPSRGLVSTDGVCAMAPSLDHIGPMASDADGCALLLEAMRGVGNTQPAAQTPARRFGYLPNLLNSGLDPEVRAAYRRVLDAAERMGLNLIACALPDISNLQETWDCICAKETARSHATSYPAQKHSYGTALAALIEKGLGVSDEDYAEALKRHAEITVLWNKLFDEIDWLAIPVHAAIPPLLDNALGAPNKGLGNPLEFTAAANLTGLPAFAFSAGCDSRGCPIGMQIMAPMHADSALLALGSRLQENGLRPLSLFDQAEAGEFDALEERTISTR
ncbi:amidase [Ochrobactrum sp. Q0168]|uniref:amidase n=1 Tax=Ochrobactrum sp. Q0168 TaxID=2793241 RepID=UPI0018ECB01B|nr:amidase [Ochrobactrum sp. Q0168]